MHSQDAGIDQVLIIELKKVINPRGHLLEVQRQDDAQFPGFGQTYVTATNPGVVKAWYRHHRQIDQLALLKGNVTLVLFDTREHASSYRNLLEIQLNEAHPLLVQIPPGVWHGFQSTAAEPSLMLHLNSEPFDFAHTDEDRLSPDDPLIPYQWTR